MANNEQYPRFIPDKPTGDDVFEGQSQTNLANNICEYIRSNDSASSRGRGQMPRIIGLEGKWGSGKSNVVEKIKKDLEGEGYYTFTYDAWGHQEDLQRRSILETLTNALIEDKVLEGKVVSIKDFGAFLEFAPGKEGMVHISKLSKERVNRVEDVLTLGDVVKVVCLGKDKMGRISFSMKDVAE